MIKHRRYGKEVHSAMPSGASHLLKIGFNAGTSERASFGKLRGFCIFRNQVGPDGKAPVDYTLMRDLIAHDVARIPQSAHAWRTEMDRLKITIDEANPVTPQAVKAALDVQFAQQLDAPDFILPKRIEFVLPSAAILVDGHWTFPGTYNERFEAYKCGGCKGLFCHGDGSTASRWQPNGTRKNIQCNPVGKEGIEDEADFCPHSVPTERTTAKGAKYMVQDCLPVGRLSIILGIRDQKMRLVPLSRMADTRFELETRSERGQARFAEALCQTAARLDGNIGGVSGTVWTGMQLIATPHHVGGTNKSLQQLGIIMNEFDIQARERERMEGRLLEGAAVRQMLLTGPSTPTPEDAGEIDPERNHDGYEDDVDVEHHPVEETPLPVSRSAVGSSDADNAQPSATHSDEKPTTKPVAHEKAEGDFGPQDTGEITVKTATDAQIIDALRRFIKTVARENEEPLPSACKRELAFQFQRGGETLTERPANVDWFLAERDKEKLARRLEIARSIAANLEAAGDIRFSIEGSGTTVAAGGAF